MNNNDYVFLTNYYWDLSYNISIPLYSNGWF